MSASAKGRAHPTAFRTGVWRVRGGWRRWGLGCPACRSGTGRLRHRPAGGLCQCAAVSGPAGAASGHPQQRRRGSGPVQGHHGPVPAEDHRPGSPGLHGAGLWRRRALGQLLCAWARHLGAQVLGVVSKPAAWRAEASGCDPSLSLTRRPWRPRWRRPQGRKVDVVYDPIGKDTLPPRWTACVPAG
jgi:hypothetical protein